MSWVVAYAYSEMLRLSAAGILLSEMLNGDFPRAARRQITSISVPDRRETASAVARAQHQPCEPQPTP